MVDTSPDLRERNLERYGIAGAGFDLSTLDATTEDEIQAHLHQWVNYTRERGIYYGLKLCRFSPTTCPDFAKLASLGAGAFPTVYSAIPRGRFSRISA
jgi:hypothetical protein